MSIYDQTIGPRFTPGFGPGFTPGFGPGFIRDLLPDSRQKRKRRKSQAPSSAFSVYGAGGMRTDGLAPLSPPPCCCIGGARRGHPGAHVSSRTCQWECQGLGPEEQVWRWRCQRVCWRRRRRQRRQQSCGGRCADQQWHRRIDGHQLRRQHNGSERRWVDVHGRRGSKQKRRQRCAVARYWYGQWCRQCDQRWACRRQYWQQCWRCFVDACGLVWVCCGRRCVDRCGHGVGRRCWRRCMRERWWC
jgi:hypothetical protein